MRRNWLSEIRKKKTMKWEDFSGLNIEVVDKKTEQNRKEHYKEKKIETIII